MATHYIVHGDTGSYIEVTCVDGDGNTPDFSAASSMQIEVFRPNSLSSVILDGTPTAVSPAATSGKLRYTFVSGDWTTIPNRTEAYAVTWHVTTSGVRQSYPGDGYDTLKVTADPQGVPSDWTEIDYVTQAEFDAYAASVTTPTYTTAALTYYVETTGDDADAGTALAPFLTIQKAIDSVPYEIRHACIIYVGAGTFAEKLRLEKDVASTGSLIIAGTWATVTPATGLASGTIASNTGRTVTVTAAGWTTNDLQDKYLRLSNGTVYPIASNTATTLEVENATSGAVSGTFDFVDHATFLNGGTSSGDTALWCNARGVQVANTALLTTVNGVLFRAMEISAYRGVRVNAGCKLYGCRVKYYQYGVMAELGAMHQHARCIFINVSSVGSSAALRGFGATWIRSDESYLRGISSASSAYGIYLENVLYAWVNTSHVIEGFGTGLHVIGLPYFNGGQLAIRSCTYGVLCNGNVTMELDGPEITGNTWGIRHVPSLTDPTSAFHLGISAGSVSSNTTAGVTLGDLSTLLLRDVTVDGNGNYGIRVEGGNSKIILSGTTALQNHSGGYGLVLYTKDASHSSVAVYSTVTTTGNFADFSIDNGGSYISLSDLRADADKSIVDSGLFNRIYQPD